MSHPLHPALVHFPIACWSLATAADVTSLWLGDPAWKLAGALLVLGTLIALAAMATGLIELMKVGAGHPASRDLNRHMLLMLTAWCLYATSLFLRLQGTALTRPEPVDLGLSVVGFLVLGVGGWFGGKLVYAHGVGVSKQP